MMDPVALSMLQQIGKPNVPGSGPSNEDNHFQSGSPFDNYDSFIIRMDHNFTDNQRLFFRVSGSRRPRLSEDIFGTPATESPTRKRLSRGAGLDYVNTLTPKLLLNVRYGLSRFGDTTIPPPDFKLTSLGFPETLAQQVITEVFPRVRIDGFATIGNQELRETFDDVHTLQGSMTRVGSRHNLKWGADVRVIRDNEFRGRRSSGDYRFRRNFTRGPDPVRGTSGHSFATFLLGTPQTGGVDNNVAPAFQNVYSSVFVQDDIRMMSNLTINLGLRYEYESPRTERFNRMTRGFAFDTSNPLQSEVPDLDLRGGLLFAGVDGQPRGQTNPRRMNFAPRFGIAYHLHPKVVLRAGYGIFFAGVTNLGAGTGASPGFSVRTPMVTSLDGVTPFHLLSDPFPDGLLAPIGASEGPHTLLGQSISFVDPKRRTPYTQQYSFGFQFQLTDNLMIETLYAGNRGIALENANVNLNQLLDEHLLLEDALQESVPNPFFGLIETGSLSRKTTSLGNLLRPFPHFGSVTVRDPTIGSATYHSFLLKVERRFSRGFTMLVAYTNAKGINDIGARESHRNIKAERALTDFLRPQRLVISGIWEFPVGPERRWSGGTNPVIRKLIEGWQMNWFTTFQGGRPLAIENDVNNTFSRGGGRRPDSTGVSAKLTGDITDRIQRYFDTDQFLEPEAFRFANLARTLAATRGPGLNNFDVSLIKNTQLTEKIRLQFRVEGFNIFNHAAFDDPEIEFGVGSFGRIRAVGHRANPARQFMLAMKLLW